MQTVLHLENEEGHILNIILTDKNTIKFLVRFPINREFLVEIQQPDFNRLMTAFEKALKTGDINFYQQFKDEIHSQDLLISANKNTVVLIVGHNSFAFVFKLSRQEFDNVVQNIRHFIDTLKFIEIPSSDYIEPLGENRPTNRQHLEEAEAEAKTNARANRNNDDFLS